MKNYLVSCNLRRIRSGRDLLFLHVEQVISNVIVLKVIFGKLVLKTKRKLAWYKTYSNIRKTTSLKIDLFFSKLRRRSRIFSH